MPKKGSEKTGRIPKWIGSEDILTITTTGAFIGNRKISKDEAVALKNDAKHFSESILWQMMRKDIHYLAYVRATNKAATQEDLFYANAMYRNLEILEAFITNCRKL